MPVSVNRDFVVKETTRTIHRDLPSSARRGIHCHDGSSRASSGCCYTRRPCNIAVDGWVFDNLLENLHRNASYRTDTCTFPQSFCAFPESQRHRGISTGTRSFSRWLTNAQYRGIQLKRPTRYGRWNFDRESVENLTSSRNFWPSRSSFSRWRCAPNSYEFKCSPGVAAGVTDSRVTRKSAFMRPD